MLYTKNDITLDMKRSARNRLVLSRVDFLSVSSSAWQRLTVILKVFENTDDMMFRHITSV